MSRISSISSNFFKKPFHTLSILKLDIAQCVAPILASVSTRVLIRDPSGIPGKLHRDFLAPPPLHNPGVPPELPQITNVLEFDTIPPEKPSDPPPLSPGPNPGPPNPSPPTPEGPRPPMPSPPGEPEAFPPHGPDVIPPKPREPGPPHPIKPDIPPPFMGSFFNSKVG
ncbi:hypothetical protein Pfo_016100 [Paulownia fortunei]|nr:hypothetical protein Pfo_016100 [Paulownia fortunei]